MDFSALAYAVQTADGALYFARDTGRARVLVNEGAGLVEVADRPFAERSVPIATWCVEAFVVAPEIMPPVFPFTLQCSVTMVVGLTLIWDIPPSCPVTQPILPNPHLPRQNLTDWSPTTIVPL